MFETFPQPQITPRIAAAGSALDAHRGPLMIARQLGLTALYNRANDAGVVEADIARLREIHVEIDNAVCDAYGWNGIRFDHGFHQTAQGVRFTISQWARREVLRRLLELNQQRHADEVAHRGIAGKGGRHKHRAGQMELVEA